MAPSPDITVVTILPWPHFQAFIDAFPAIGGKLYTYVPSTSTPKASFSDPYLIVPNSNPVLLDDQGAATVYLNGLYDLRLFDADEVLIWSVDAYQFATGAPPPSPGEKIMGSTDAEVSAAPGAGVISVPGLVPGGYRCEGITWTITTGFGASQGLTGVLIGDGVAADRWARLTDVTTGQTGGQGNFRSDSTPVEPIPYTLLLASEGGLFDATGAIHLTAYWSALPADTP